MKKIVFLLSVFSMILVFCGGPEVVFKEVFEFENANWKGFGEKLFRFKVEDKESPYVLKAKLSYDERFSKTQLPIQLLITSPEGETFAKVYKFEVQDQYGNYISEVSEGLYHSELIISKKYFFNYEGTYKLEFKNLSDKFDNYGLRTLEFKIEKTK